MCLAGERQEEAYRSLGIVRGGELASLFVVDVSAARGADLGPGRKQIKHHGAVKTFGWITAGSFRLAPPSLLKRQEGTGAGNCVKASLNGKGSEGEKNPVCGGGMKQGHQGS